MRKFCLALAVAIAAVAGSYPALAQTVRATFAQPVASTRWDVAAIARDLPADWSAYDTLVLEMRASSAQRFELGLESADGFVSKRIHPRPGVWVRASIPLRFFRQGLGDAHDLAATVNMPRDSYWINIEAGGHGPVRRVTGIRVTMRYPVGRPTLELRNIRLTKGDGTDAILDGRPIMDRFGQYARVDWPGKARSEADLRAAWMQEAKALAGVTPPSVVTRFGGFADRRTRATGFFRVEKIDGRWWFVDPEGALFFSNGINGTANPPATPLMGREALFAPPVAAGGKSINFLERNQQLRFGADWRAPAAALTVARMKAWGINTAYGDALNAAGGAGVRIPYVATIRGWQTEGTVMGLPDVYDPGFAARVERIAREQLAPKADDPWMVGYFIGNEPPWPGRESQLVDLVLAGPERPIRARWQAALAKEDTPDVRRALVLDAFAQYLRVINAAVKRADPNHLNLGIRFGGTPPMYVVRLARGFDVYSMNKYRWTPPRKMIDEIYADLKLPILIGEFHVGVPGRGLAPGLVQARDQRERGAAYSYYVENAAAHPAIVGTHWFQWADQPATGRTDGENYNIGWVDVTDRPYAALAAAGRTTHARIAAIHAGRLAPTTRMAIASDAGTPADTIDFGIPAIQ